MSKERATDLARQCTELVRRGNDFPTVWFILLESHVLVNGIPRQRLERNRNLLDIPLITGEQLEHTDLIIDVVPGRGGMFSLDNGRERRFLTRSKICAMPAAPG